MSIEDLLYRLRNRFDEYWHSEKRSVKLLSRLLAFTLFGAIVSTIAPTLADELASSPQMIQPVTQSNESSTVTISESQTASPAPSQSFTPEAVVSRPPVANRSESPLPESSDSATAAGPGVPLEVQPKYIVKVPPSGAIDPRAATYFLPHIYLATSDPNAQFTMACISGTSGMKFDALQKGSANNSPQVDPDSPPAELVSGDQTGVLILSAETNRLVNLINSYNGLFITTWSGGLSGRSLTLRFVAVTKPVVDPAFCSAAKSGAIMTLRPLGLDLSTVKGSGTLK